MDISFREARKNSIDDYILVSKWNNDDSIKHLIIPNFTEGGVPDPTPEELYGHA